MSSPDLVVGFAGVISNSSFGVAAELGISGKNKKAEKIEKATGIDVIEARGRELIAIIETEIAEGPTRKMAIEAVEESLAWVKVAISK